ncbi:hypothetical protein [Lapidilactobacillus bayanensis]|uniref:hypothetical protein n=1 Tax=Lapidilactobacillus bayanensis TaxID=2485998 RepID=UPI000F7919EC|nr:hypothetical protein [Lapidilactobacillus bayanensis]
MGSRMMHYTIGQVLAQRYGFSARFLLGAIAPDVQKNMAVAKDASHFIDRDERGFGEINLQRFINQYQAQWNDEFVQGYYCHLIADEVWLQGPINQQARQWSFGSPEREQYIDQHYQDFHSFNAILRDQYQLTPPTFAFAKDYPIQEIAPQFLPALVADLRDDFNDRRRPLQVLAEAQIERYLQQASAVYVQTLAH